MCVLHIGGKQLSSLTYITNNRKLVFLSTVSLILWEVVGRQYFHSCLSVILSTKGNFMRPFPIMLWISPYSTPAPHATHCAGPCSPCIWFASLYRALAPSPSNGIWWQDWRPIHTCFLEDPLCHQC